MRNTQTGSGKVGKKSKYGISPNRTTLPNIYCSFRERAEFSGKDKRIKSKSRKKFSDAELKQKLTISRSLVKRSRMQFRPLLKKKIIKEGRYVIGIIVILPYKTNQTFYMFYLFLSIIFAITRSVHRPAF